MSDIIQDLQHHISKAFFNLFQADLPADQIKIELTRKEFEGDFTFVVFPHLRITKMKPEDSAQVLGDDLARYPEIDSYNVIKGFLNLKVSDEYWIRFISKLKNVEKFGKGDSREKVMVEYSSPNTNKPLHLGHIRNNLLGFAVSNILEHAGNDVVKTNLVNDRGIHICKSMLAWKKFGEGATPESTGIKGDHFVGHYYVEFDKALKEEIAKSVAAGKTQEEAEGNSQLMMEVREMLQSWEKGDEDVTSLWKMMNSWVYDGFDSTYKRLGVGFDKIYYESDTYLLGKEFVQDGLKDQVFFKKEDGSIWVDLQDADLDEKLLLRADGTSVYITQDIGTADLKFNDYGMDRSIYVVGNEQDYHFNVLKLILAKLGKPYSESIFHLSYGMVDLPEGKMKSREGTVVDADDLMDEMYETARKRTIEQGKTEGMEDSELFNLYETVGLGALKYYLLRVDASKRMLFNPEESIDLQGNTATFIQYTYARCRSILRSANLNEVHLDDAKLSEQEQALIQHIHMFPYKAKESADTMNPSIICSYTYELAKAYNSFYNANPILKESNENSRSIRLKITSITSELLKKNLGLLGISVPERM